MDKQKTHYLSDIGFQRILPSPELQPFIQWFWSIQSNGRVLIKRHEFMHSKGALSLLFNWVDELKLSTGNYSQSAILQCVSSLSRQMTLVGDIQTFGILFRPGGAFPFFKISMQEMVSIDDLYRLNLSQLHQQLSEIPTLQGKIRWSESWLLRLLTAKQSPSIIISTSLKLIDSSYGNLSMQKVADNICLSGRQLERVFKKEVGLSPKKYANIVRLHQARLRLKKIDTASLAEIAHDTGFYDQAHFSREFKKIVGTTPGAYIYRCKNRDRP